MTDARVGIAYLDGPRLRRSLLAACTYAQAQRSELNRINVFPVPDGDTGTNLALTARTIADHLRSNVDTGVGVVAHEAAEAAVLGARGNCGMMLSHFLLGFAEALEGHERVDSAGFTLALRTGVKRLYEALDRPVEGTIITVMRETAEAAEADPQRDFAKLWSGLIDRAREALENTPKLLPVLRSAGVVDAGAKGFVSLLEGVRLLIRGESLDLEAPEDVQGARVAVADVELEGEGEQFRFCTEALVRGRGLPTQDRVRADLEGRGDSLLVIRSGDLLKVHIHTDDPEAVFAYLRTLGTLATHKAEDMHAQHAAVGRAARSHVMMARRPVVVVTDSACDLPEEVIRAHGIHVTPLALIMEDGDVLRDRVDVSAEDFQSRLSDGGGPLPTTSQPAPADFLRVFEQAAEEGEEILGVILGSGLSGTYGSAVAAARRFDNVPVHLVDSRGASLLQGLMTLRAAELAELATPPAEIVERLERARDRSGVLLTVDTFDRLLASGRVGRGKAILGSMLRLKPILEVGLDGTVHPVSKVRGRRRVLPSMMDALEERVPDDAGRVRFGIAHVCYPEIVHAAGDEIRRRWGPDTEILSAAATPVISTHTGPRSWAVAFLVEDD